VGDWFISPVHPLEDNWEELGYRKGTYPVAEELCEKVVNLPTHAGVSEAEALQIVRAILN